MSSSPAGRPLSRRSWLSLAAAGGAAAAVAPGLLRAQPDQRPPNIVLIVADDLGSTDLGCYGAADLRTPHLDSLAGSGMRFTAHYVTAPVCTPSRASLLTGREHARVLRRSVGLEADETTLAELLRGAGYRTGIFGKWHLGIPQGHGPLAQGFDEFLGFKVGALDNYSHQYRWGAGAGHRLWRGDAAHHEDGVYFPDIVTREATGFIERHADRPFFLYLPYNLPHYPLQAPDSGTAAVAHIADPARRAYAACLHALDAAVGQVTDTLTRFGLRDDTLVVFLSDHGHSVEAEAMGGGGRAAPFRGHKGTLLEGGIRVPCIASWPGRYPAGVTRTQLTSSMDWVPTIAALAGVSLEGLTVDGRSLEPLLHAPEATIHESLCWAWQQRWAVREGRWKLLGDGPSQMALYDLLADPEESHDRLPQRQDVFRRLARVRNQWAETLRDDPTVIRELGL